MARRSASVLSNSTDGRLLDTLTHAELLSEMCYRDALYLGELNRYRQIAEVDIERLKEIIDDLLIAIMRPNPPARSERPN